jgi:DNA-binding CsgD family transcriptional regulator
MLAERDVRAVEGLVGELADVEDLHAFAERTVCALLALMPTDAGYGFNELRQEPFRVAFSYEDPPAPDDVPDIDEAMDTFWRQSPTATPSVGAGGGVYRWSDLIGERDKERLDIWQLVFRPVGSHHLAKVVFPSGPLVSDAFMLGRTATDFSDRDMEILRALYPFLFFAHRAVQARERARVAEDALGSNGIGVILLGHDDHVLGWLGSAASIVGERYGPVNGRLPAELAAWVATVRSRRPLEGSPSAPLALRTGHHTTLVRLLPGSEGDRLLLEDRHTYDGTEHARAHGLTAREIEVLSIVRSGKTNRQIADALVLAPTTVRRHLENIFAKLDVGTRTAAVAKAFGM